MRDEIAVKGQDSDGRATRGLRRGEILDVPFDPADIRPEALRDVKNPQGAGYEGFLR